MNDLTADLARAELADAIRIAYAKGDAYGSEHLYGQHQPPYPQDSEEERAWLLGMHDAHERAYRYADAMCRVPLRESPDLTPWGTDLDYANAQLTRYFAGRKAENDKRKDRK